MKVPQLHRFIYIAEFLIPDVSKNPNTFTVKNKGILLGLIYI